MTSEQIIKKWKELGEERMDKLLVSVTAYEEYKKNPTKENKIRLDQAQDESDLSYEVLRTFLDHDWK